MIGSNNGKHSKIAVLLLLGVSLFLSSTTTLVDAKKKVKLPFADSPSD